jgi:TolA-binding protein
MIRYIIFIVLICCLLDSCSPVRSKTSKRVAVGSGSYPSGTYSAGTYSDSANAAFAEPPKNFFDRIRFSDTTKVTAKVTDKPREKTISDMLDEAVNQFDKEEYDKACPTFEHLLETFVPGDSLYYETAFMVCECMVARNELKEAHDFLINLNNSSNLPQLIKQKVLVRLGHIKCVEGDKAAANFLFEELKSTFPKSIYLRLATCEALE